MSSFGQPFQFLVVVEPGTPKGYQSVLQARELCIAREGIIYAPCSHAKACPWEKTNEWCHFGVRLQRSDGHRLAKEGSLSYEDEKFSYVVLSKQAVAPAFSKLLKNPLRRKGHTLITLCAKEGIEQKTITKKDKEHYKLINKLKWGDKVINSV